MSGKTGRVRSLGGKPFSNCLSGDCFEFLLFVSQSPTKASVCTALFSWMNGRV